MQAVFVVDYNYLQKDPHQLQIYSASRVFVWNLADCKSVKILYHVTVVIPPYKYF